MLAMAVLGVTSLAPRAYAGTVYVADTPSVTLNRPSAYVGGVGGCRGSGLMFVQFNGSLTNHLAWTMGADPINNTDSIWAGVQILSPVGPLRSIKTVVRTC